MGGIDPNWRIHRFGLEIAFWTQVRCFYWLEHARNPVGVCVFCGDAL